MTSLRLVSGVAVLMLTTGCASSIGYRADYVGGHADVADERRLGRGFGTTRGWVLAVGTGDGLLDRPYTRFDV